ncbi:prepilin peptidase [Methylobacillus flagellatus]|uniref:Prepilin leader peptidase/N-methyltransferase n=1 Tax=Methylobacillus flagellatus (strain ATCC 51484 / DSM 6875 / VKM B-1610 / KT) TaxID=265072 RepID=Q1GZ45_METFK|nr:A24 family peptidase [Methylobacillus flagellatus]ABE50492.1 type 4 prepilin peptidase 1, Aspartic peptidase, MEROPS family A24A [Methylobacillus flagellatus KT]
MPEFVFLDALRDNPALFITCSALLGLMVGSFLNVVIYRLPRMMELAWHAERLEAEGQPQTEQARYNLITPRSRCPHCQHAITALENIPIISYMMLGGKCRQCKTAISPRYPLVELLTATLTGLASWHFGYSSLAVASWLIIFALIALTFIDLDTHLLPDDITLPLLWAGLLFNLDHGFTDISSAVIGAAAGYLVLWSVYWLFKLITGKEGMGYGDFKLLAALGAWFGWQLLPAVILLSSVAGSIIGIGLIVLTKHGRETPIPFGPYLALGGIAALFCGEQLSQLYLGG